MHAEGGRERVMAITMTMMMMMMMIMMIMMMMMMSLIASSSPRDFFESVSNNDSPRPEVGRRKGFS